MPRVLFCCLLLGVWACSAPEPTSQPAPPTAATQPEPARASTRLPTVRPAADSIVLVRLIDGVTLRWSNRNSELVDDKLLRTARTRFAAKQDRIVAAILDTTATAAVACAGSRDSFSLTTGDVAFLLVLKVKHIPWYSVYGQQWDSFDYGCPYPGGMLDYVAANRATVWQQTANYLAEAERAASSAHKPAK